MENEDLSTLALTPEEQAAFGKFEKADKASLTDSERKALYRLKFLKGANGWFGDLPQDNLFELNERGKRYRELRREKLRSEEKADRQWKVTTVISWIALALSAVSILLQVIQGS